MDYLRVLSQSIDQFQKVESDAAAPAAPTQAESVPELPGRVTLAWEHVPVSIWFWSLGLLAAAFISGATVGQIEWVQKLIESW